MFAKIKAFWVAIKAWITFAKATQVKAQAIAAPVFEAAVKAAAPLVVDAATAVADKAKTKV